MAVYSKDGINLNDIAYGTSGIQLEQAYDTDGNELFSGEPPIEPTIELVNDYSTGTYFGYSFHVQNDGTEYKMYEIANLLQYDSNLQSFGYDSDNEQFYKFDEQHRIRVFDKDFQLLDTFYNNDLTGHCNDVTFYDGVFYFPDVDNTPGVNWWNPSTNTAGRLVVTGIQQPTSGSTRTTAAICKAEGNNSLFYLACADYTGDSFVHLNTDKLSIYLYDLNTGIATLQHEFTWEDRYIQGMCLYDGIIYVIGNIMGSSSDSGYRGLIIRPYVIETWEALNPLLANGNFEPESINLYPFADNGKPEFMFGVGRYQAISKIVRCTIPYRIVYPNS